MDEDQFPGNLGTVEKTPVITVHWLRKFAPISMLDVGQRMMWIPYVDQSARAGAHIMVCAVEHTGMKASIRVQMFTESRLQPVDRMPPLNRSGGFVVHRLLRYIVEEGLGTEGLIRAILATALAPLMRVIATEQADDHHVG